MPDPPLIPSRENHEGPARLRAIAGVATSIAAFVGPALQGRVEAPHPVSSFVDFEAEFGGLALNIPLGYAVRDFFANGGRDALICRTETNLSGSVSERAASYARGFESVARAHAFNLLCVPPDVRGGWASESAAPILAAAASLCVERRAMLVADPPTDFIPHAPTLPQLGLTNTTARNVALYFPFVIQSDPLQALQPAPFPPCGAIAGVIARTDLARGVWHAASGTHATLAGVTGLATSLTDVETGRLTSNGVNCLRTFPSSGPVVWGARTLSGSDALADEYKYVPVRRLAIFIEDSVNRAMTGLPGPSVEPLWLAIRHAVSAFLHGLWIQGALRGNRPQEAYAVQCDASTMTADDIERGLVRVRVGFAPLRPAEFIIITMQQMLCGHCSP